MGSKHKTKSVEPFTQKVTNELTGRLSVIIVEDEDLYRELLAFALNHRPGLQVVGAYATGEAALAQAEAARPDVVVLDITLGGGMNGIQLGLRLRRTLPRLGIVLLSNTLRPSMLRQIPDAALYGWSYLHKRNVSHLEVLEHAIKAAASGLMALDPAIRTDDAAAANSRAPLTDRQHDVLRLMAQGYRNEAIAERLGLSEKSVANYTNAIYERLRIDVHAPGTQPRVKAVVHFLTEPAEDQ